MVALLMLTALVLLGFYIYTVSNLKKRIRRMEAVISGGKVASGKRPLNVLHLLNSVRLQTQAWMPPVENKYDNGWWNLARLSSPSLNRQLDNYLTAMVTELCNEDASIRYQIEPSPNYDEIKIQNIVIVKIFDYEQIIPCLTQDEAERTASALKTKSIDARATQILSNSVDVIDGNATS